MKIKLLVAFVVTWRVVFFPTVRGEPIQYMRAHEFQTKKEAVEFYSHKPTEGVKFECVRYGTDERGYCEIFDVRLENKP